MTLAPLELPVSTKGFDVGFDVPFGFVQPEIKMAGGAAVKHRFLYFKEGVLLPFNG